MDAGVAEADVEVDAVRFVDVVVVGTTRTMTRVTRTMTTVEEGPLAVRAVAVVAARMVRRTATRARAR